MHIPPARSTSGVPSAFGLQMYRTMILLHQVFQQSKTVQEFPCVLKLASGDTRRGHRGMGARSQQVVGSRAHELPARPRRQQQTDVGRSALVSPYGSLLVRQIVVFPRSFPARTLEVAA